MYRYVRARPRPSGGVRCARYGAPRIDNFAHKRSADSLAAPEQGAELLERGWVMPRIGQALDATARTCQSPGTPLRI
jgi:hypothetical protein